MQDEIIITYVYHSCYTVESKDLFLVFDYYKGLLNIPEDKEVIFFASHEHEDHYTSEILKVPDMQNKTYVLSNDIGKSPTNENIIYIRDNKLTMDQLKSLYGSKNVHFVKANQNYKVKVKSGKVINVKTFGSTDAGVSFLISLDGINIFHAGDLNYWAWPEYDKNKLKEEYDAFYKEIQKLKKENVDLAFFPVDNRLGENYDLGPDIFIKEVKPQLFLPMHFGSNEEISIKFADKHNYPTTEVRRIYQVNQKLFVEI